jgi:hypothetical protein
MTFLHGSSLISKRQQLVDEAGTHSTTDPNTYDITLRFLFDLLLCLICKYVNDISATLSKKLLLVAGDLGVNL